MTTKFNVTCDDGRVISATKYSAIEPSKNKLIIINSALGVRQSFYQPLAVYLSENGYAVITWDPRSIGESKTENVKLDSAKLRDWGAVDLEAMLNHVVNAHRTSWDNITLIGHSAGGHLVGLCRSINKVRNIVLVCSGSCDWRLYPITQQPKFWLAWYVVFPVLIKVLGYIPGQLGIGHDLSPGVASDWRNWSIRKNYLFADRTLTDTYYHEYDGSIHSIGFSDDVGFSPKKTIYDLMTRFPIATKQTQIFHPKELGQNKIGHFGFFKKHQKAAWQEILMNVLSND